MYWCSDEKIKISINTNFARALQQLLVDPSFSSNNDAVQALKALFPLLSFESKVGVKSLLLRENGEPLKRTPIPEIEVEEYENIVYFRVYRKLSLT